MTKEEFKAEILKANPQAVFIERRNGDLECTETEMLVGGIAKNLQVVYGFSREGFAKTKIADFQQMSAPEPKKKRLMTPQECAGKWIFNPDNGGRALIIGFSAKETVHFRAECVTVARLHSEGVLIADTPTSEPHSLEVED
ncbi:MAG: hypothetical protein ACEQSB_06395 [Undibacterium sp.]